MSEYTITKNDKDPKPMYWDELTKAYADSLAILKQMQRALEDTYKLLGNKIENDDELKKLYTGLIKTLNINVNELKDLVSLHSEKIEENGTVQLVPYKGKVNVKDSKAAELYIDLMLGYSGFMDKVVSMMQSSIPVFLAKVKEKTGIEVNLEGDDNE